MAIKDTVGASDANCYVTLAEAQAYFDDRTHAEDWEALMDQSSALVTASRQLDWYAKWKGYKTYPTQSMGWPRTDVLISDGTYASSTTIPAAIKVAVFELALSSITDDRTADSVMAGFLGIKAGSVELKADDGLYNSAPKTIPSKIWKILAGYTLRSGGSLVWLLRA